MTTLFYSSFESPMKKNTGNNRYTLFFGTLAQSNIQKMCATSLVHPHKMITPRDHPDVGPSPFLALGALEFGHVHASPFWQHLERNDRRVTSSCRVISSMKDRPYWMLGDL